MLTCAPNMPISCNSCCLYCCRSWSNYTNCVDYGELGFRNAIIVRVKQFMLLILLQELVQLHQLCGLCRPGLQKCHDLSHCHRNDLQTVNLIDKIDFIVFYYQFCMALFPLFQILAHH
jgi:hypothetical protein